jgi:hypothetical protein
VHVRGQDKLTAYSTSKTIGTGNTMTSSFCSVCGTLMYRRSSGFPGLSFNLHETNLRPQAEQFVESMVGWLQAIKDVPQAEGMSTK